MRREKTDFASFGQGFFEGITKVIDQKAAERQKEIELQRDITKYKLQKDYDAKIQKDWFQQMKGQMEQQGGQQGFIRETGTPAAGMAQLFGSGVEGGTQGQVPYVMTEETPEGRQPMVEQDIDYGALGGAQTMRATRTGASIAPMSAQDKMLNAYNALQKIEESGRTLNPQQQYLKKGLERKLFSAGMGKAEGTITQSKRKIVGDIRGLKNANASLEDISEHIRLQGYEPEEFADELQGYSAEERSIWQNIANNPTIKKVSQAIEFLQRVHNYPREKAIELIRNMQNAS
jgi:hypothetical protein